MKTQNFQEPALMIGQSDSTWRMTFEARGALVGQPWRVSAVRADWSTTSHNLAKRFPDTSPSNRSGNPTHDKFSTRTSCRNGSHRSGRIWASQDSVALAFQLRAIPKTSLASRIRSLTDAETAEVELAVDEALGRLEPEAR